MARTPPAKAPAVDLENTSLPANTFEPFEWTLKNSLMGTRVPAITLCELADRVKDVASAASLVFELMTARDVDIDAEVKPYLGEHQIYLLQRLAMRSLRDLEDHADKIASDMNKLAGGNV